MQTPTWCRERAAQIGPATLRFIELLLGDEVLDRLRGAQATPRLAEVDGIGEARLEAACRRWRRGRGVAGQRLAVEAAIQDPLDGLGLDRVARDRVPEISGLTDDPAARSITFTHRDSRAALTG